MLDRRDQVLDVIQAINAAVIAPDGWSRALDRLSDAMGESALFLGTTPKTGGHFELNGHRIDARSLELINGPLATREANPVFSVVSGLLRSNRTGAVFKPLVISSVLDDRTFVRSNLYTNVLEPIGIRHSMAVVLESSSERAISLTLGRRGTAGDYNAADVGLLAAIAPQLHCALTVQRELALARAGAMVLDNLDRGVILLGQNAKIRFTNREADRILGSRDGLSSGIDGLRAERSDETRQLRRLIFECALAAAGKCISSGGALSITRPSMSAPYWVQVFPAAAPMMPAACGINPEPMAAVYIKDAERRSSPSQEAVRMRYGLTRAEAELALHLYEGRTLSQISDILGISINTAKTHLKMIFEKVGVSRQSALIRELSATLLA